MHLGQASPFGSSCHPLFGHPRHPLIHSRKVRFPFSRAYTSDIAKPKTTSYSHPTLNHSSTPGVVVRRRPSIDSLIDRSLPIRSSGYYLGEVTWLNRFASIPAWMKHPTRSRITPRVACFSGKAGGEHGDYVPVPGRHEGESI